MLRLAPSILSADFGRLESELSLVERAGAQVIHVDVMDGHFVPNITIGPLVVEALRRYTGLPLDVHLMIDNPERYVDAFIDAGADWIAFHTEAAPHAHRLIQRIKNAGKLAGVAVNPGTSLTTIEGVMEYVDYVLIMSVNPGFGGQSFIPGSLEKIAGLRRLLDNGDREIDIEVDGGVTLDNVRSVVDAGARIVVAGSAVFGAQDPARTVGDFLQIFQTYT